MIRYKARRKITVHFFLLFRFVISKLLRCNAFFFSPYLSPKASKVKHRRCKLQKLGRPSKQWNYNWKIMGLMRMNRSLNWNAKKLRWCSKRLFWHGTIESCKNKSLFYGLLGNEIIGNFIRGEVGRFNFGKVSNNAQELFNVTDLRKTSWNWHLSVMKFISKK